MSRAGGNLNELMNSNAMGEPPVWREAKGNEIKASIKEVMRKV